LSDQHFLCLYSNDLEPIGISKDDVLSKYGRPSSIDEPSKNLLHELIFRLVSTCTAFSSVGWSASCR